MQVLAGLRNVALAIRIFPNRGVSAWRARRRGDQRAQQIAADRPSMLDYNGIRGSRSAC